MALKALRLELEDARSGAAEQGETLRSEMKFAGRAAAECKEESLARVSRAESELRERDVAAAELRARFEEAARADEEDDNDSKRATEEGLERLGRLEAELQADRDGAAELRLQLEAACAEGAESLRRERRLEVTLAAVCEGPGSEGPSSPERDAGADDAAGDLRAELRERDAAAELLRGEARDAALEGEAAARRAAQLEQELGAREAAAAELQTELRDAAERGDSLRRQLHLLEAELRAREAP